MNKNIILLAILLALGGFGFWKWSNHTTDTFAKDIHTQFAYEHVEQLGRIFIADRNNNQALLEKKDGSWYYTNKATGKTYLANPTVVATLLETIKNIRTRGAVAAPAVDNVVNSMAANSKKVELYDESGNRVRTYYVGTPALNGQGTHMMMEGAERPYIVYYPNWVGTLDTRFTLNEKTLRSRYIFKTNPQTIEFVQVEYTAPSQVPYSFRVVRKNGDNFDVQPLSGKTQKLTTLNQANVLTYINGFDEAWAELIIDDKTTRDTTIIRQPFATITYKTTADDAPKAFKLYSINNPTADRGDGDPGHRQKIQRYYVDIDAENFLLAQHLVIRKVLWGYPYFFQKDAVVLEEDEEVFVQQPMPHLQDLPEGND